MLWHVLTVCLLFAGATVAQPQAELPSTDIKSALNQVAKNISQVSNPAERDELVRNATSYLKSLFSHKEKGIFGIRVGDKDLNVVTETDAKVTPVRTTTAHKVIHTTAAETTEESESTKAATTEPIHSTVATTTNAPVVITKIIYITLERTTNATEATTTEPIHTTVAATTTEATTNATTQAVATKIVYIYVDRTTNATEATTNATTTEPQIYTTVETTTNATEVATNATTVAATTVEMVHTTVETTTNATEPANTTVEMTTTEGEIIVIKHNLTALTHAESNVTTESANITVIQSITITNATELNETATTAPAVESNVTSTNHHRTFWEFVNRTGENITNFLFSNIFNESHVESVTSATVTGAILVGGSNETDNSQTTEANTVVVVNRTTEVLVIETNTTTMTNTTVNAVETNITTMANETVNATEATVIIMIMTTTNQTELENVNTTETPQTTTVEMLNVTNADNITEAQQNTTVVVVLATETTTNVTNVTETAIVTMIHSLETVDNTTTTTTANVSTATTIIASVESTTGDGKSNRVGYILRVTEGKSWDDQLAVPDSWEFTNFQQYIEPGISKLLKNSVPNNEYLSSKVVKFAPGSVIVFGELLTTKPLNQAEVQPKVRDAIRAEKNKIADYTVDPDSFEFVDPKSTAAFYAQSGSGATMPGWGVGLLVAAIVIICLLALISVILYEHMQGRCTFLSHLPCMQRFSKDKHSAVGDNMPNGHDISHGDDLELENKKKLPDSHFVEVDLNSNNAEANQRGTNQLTSTPHKDGDHPQYLYMHYAIDGKPEDKQDGEAVKSDSI